MVQRRLYFLTGHGVNAEGVPAAILHPWGALSVVRKKRANSAVSALKIRDLISFAPLQAIWRNPLPFCGL
jgi:hypothetical protein